MATGRPRFAAPIAKEKIRWGPVPPTMFAMLESLEAVAPMDVPPGPDIGTGVGPRNIKNDRTEFSEDRVPVKPHPRKEPGEAGEPREPREPRGPAEPKPVVQGPAQKPRKVWLLSKIKSKR